MTTQTILSILASLAAPLHLASYSFLTGMQLYQSFIVVKVVHRTLPRPAFTTLQARLFPIYFRLQTVLLILTAMTYPPYGPVSLLSDKIALVSLSIAGVAAGLNLSVYGPRTRVAMLERAGSGSSVLEREPLIPGESEENVVDEAKGPVNRRFHKSHAMSIHLNLITIGATLIHGWRLVSRLQIA